MKDLVTFDGFFHKPDIFRVLWLKLKDKYASENFSHKGVTYPFKRISGNPAFPTEPNTITAIGIRNNEEISFNDELTDNDDLIVDYYEACKEQGAVIITAYDQVYARTKMLSGFEPITSIENYNIQPGKTIVYMCGLGGRANQTYDCTKHDNIG